MTPAQIAAKPADKRTPIEQAILLIESEIEHVHDALFAISMLQSLLPAEREAIETAFNIGYIDCVTYVDYYSDGEDYFTQKYGQ